jgi:RNA polymerase sigma factor (TIGR02999 family)
MSSMAHTEDDSRPVTQLLAAWRGGDAHALEQLTPLIYRELRRLASVRLLSERDGHTLAPTALVHEAFLRLAGQANNPNWENRSHFFAIASHLMRQILIQYARAHKAEKRGGSQADKVLDLESAGPIAVQDRAGELVALDEALERLAGFDPRKARAVELRFFGGMTVPEVASVMELSTATVERDMRTALAWLRRELLPS